MYQKPILQLVDNCTYGIIALPCVKSSLLEHTICLNLEVLGSDVNLLKKFPCFKVQRPEIDATPLPVFNFFNFFSKDQTKQKTDSEAISSCSSF